MPRNKEGLLTAILSVNFGLVFLDRNALNYMMPFVAPELKLANYMVGILAGATALSWALSGVLFSSLSDRIGRRKLIVVVATIAFSLLSVLSGFATGFVSLLVIRFVLGIAEGPILPLSQTMIAMEARADRRGLLMGIMNNLGSNLLGVMIAPPLLILIATAVGWRTGFQIVGVPGLFMAIVILALVHEPAAAAERGGDEFDAAAIPVEGRKRNLILCIAISCCMLGWTLLGWAFLPLHLVRVNHFTPSTMGMLMAVLGASAVVSSIFVPGLSDRVGRKPAIVIFAALGTVTPLAVVGSGLGAGWLAPILFIGWAASGTLPLFMATIPAESISPRQLAGAMALVMGTGEIVGGAAMPILAGFVGDAYGLSAVLYIEAGCAVLAACLALFLIETAPAKRNVPIATPQGAI